MATKNKCYCDVCGNTMDEGQFYLSRNVERFPPNGRLKQCKKCITMYVDNWNPDTFLPILEQIDVPYVKQEWDKTLAKELERCASNPDAVTGMTVIGKYLAKMRIKQFKDARWADSEALQKKIEETTRGALRARGASEEEIEQTIADDAVKQVPKPEVGKITPTGPVPQSPAAVEEEDIDLGLTDEDITYLRLKWGRGYTHSQWVQMEQLYNDMCASYDIQTAGHKDTLKMVCKTSLLANEAIDMHDIEGFQKLSKTYDLLMKSGKFTAAQNKESRGEFVDSVGELVMMCEKEKFIPRYYQAEPADVVDQTLADLQKYTKRLIMDEMGLGEQIESATKKLLEAQANENKLDDDDEDETREIEDYEEFDELREQQEEEDLEYMTQLITGGDKHGTK